MPGPTSSQQYAWYGALNSGKGLIRDAFGNPQVVGACMPGGAASGNVLTSDANGNLTLQPPSAGAAILVAAPSGDTTGTTDLANINTAIAALPSGGGWIQLQAGTYIVPAPASASSGCISLSVNNTVLAGAGMGTTVVQLAAGSADVTGIIRTPSGVQNNDITVRDLTIDGNAAAQTGSPRVIGFYCGVTPNSTQTDTDITLSRVEVKNCIDAGFDPHERTTRLTMIACLGHDNASNGLHDNFTLDACYDSVLIGCVAYNSGRHGFNLVTACHDVRLIGCEAYSNTGAGFVLQNGTKESVLSGCISRDNTLEGILVNGVPQVGQQDNTPGYNNAVKGCTVLRSGTHGIHLTAGTGETIAGNTVRDSSQTTTNTSNQIYLDESGSNFTTSCVVTGNDCQVTSGITNLPKYSIAEKTSSENNNIVAGNQVSGASTADLNLLGANTIAYAAHNGTSGAHPAQFAYANDTPANHGYKEWNWDPNVINTTSQLMTTGTVYFLAFNCQANETIGTVATYQGVAGVSLTAGQNLIGFYTLSGGVATLQSSVDMTTPWGTGANSGGAVAGALGAAQTVTSGQTVLIGLLANGTTAPSFARAANSGGPANVGLSKTSPYRASTYTSTGQTALPTPVTLSSQITATSAVAFWAALA